MSPGHIRVSIKHCPFQSILDRIGDKWSLLIIMQLSHGSLRFSELKRLIDGISQRMLTLTLRNLERDGLVSRKVTPIIPPRVDYDLTQLGATLLPSVTALLNWAHANLPAVESARDIYDSGRGVPAADLPVLAKTG